MEDRKDLRSTRLLPPKDRYYRYIKQREDEVGDLRKRLRTDSLTHLSSREELTEELSLIEKENKPACAIYIDIDNFKKRVNDLHGHYIGDKVLDILGLRILSRISKKDIAGRLGGEEFLVILPDFNDLSICKIRAEELRGEIAKDPFAVENSKGEILNLKTTVSIGISLRKSGEESALWINRADKAMYLAKKSGKNRVKTELDLRNE